MKFNNKDIYFLFVFFLFVLTSCNNKYFLGKEYLLVNDGYGGDEFILERKHIYDIDSIYLTSFRHFVDCFTLEIIRGNGENYVLKSNTNRLTDKMKIILNDYPDVQFLIFKNFCFVNSKGKEVNIKKNERIKIIVADYKN